MVDSSMMPELGFLVDIRHSAVYGGVYAIGDAAFCLGFAIGKGEWEKDWDFKLKYVKHLGPALSGSLVKAVGFKAMLITVGIVSIIYGPLLFMLKNPPPRTDQEKQESAVSIFHFNNFNQKWKLFYLASGFWEWKDNSEVYKLRRTNYWGWKPPPAIMEITFRSSWT